MKLTGAACFRLAGDTLFAFFFFFFFFFLSRLCKRLAIYMQIRSKEFPRQTVTNPWRSSYRLPLPLSSQSEPKGVCENDCPPNERTNPIVISRLAVSQTPRDLRPFSCPLSDSQLCNTELRSFPSIGRLIGHRFLFDRCYPFWLKPAPGKSSARSTRLDYSTTSLTS